MYLYYRIERIKEYLLVELPNLLPGTSINHFACLLSVLKGIGKPMNISRDVQQSLLFNDMGNRHFTFQFILVILTALH